ncbi:MAG TPA: amino acid racemase [Synergistales bacterium]|jgi:aspartate racemase|nr:amino acid racemase [Synergistales bacterium]HRV71327.1 amino acid racemase [Thermovirgaceae bacterium]
MSKKPHKVLGILGGMGPAATAEFLRLLAEMAGAEKDQDHPRIVLFSNPQIPDRTAAITGGGEDPAPLLLEGLKTLQSWGAQLLAVPCNTAHVFINRFRDRLSVPLVHIVEETISRAMRTSPGGAWLTATSGTSSSRIYETEAKKRDYPLLIPGPETQNMLEEVIALVKANRLSESAARLESCLRILWSEKDIPVIGACTELPLAYRSSAMDQEKIISSLDSLALACLERIYSPS